MGRAQATSVAEAEASGSLRRCREPAETPVKRTRFRPCFTLLTFYVVFFG
jgi:hypothetical protein